jgi:hypothetical protein
LRRNGRGQAGRQGGFFVGYICHDYHMLVYAAMLAGCYAPAVEYLSLRVIMITIRAPD